MKLRLSIRISKFEFGISYNRTLKQVIIWIGKRYFSGPFIQIKN